MTDLCSKSAWASASAFSLASGAPRTASQVQAASAT